MTRKMTGLVLTVLLVAAGTAWGDGMIVPVRPDLPVRGQWSVKHHHVDILVKDQVATVHIDQAFVNEGRGDLEVEYLFPIPPDAAIHNMTLLVDGKELAGKMMEAKEARQIYEDIVRKKKDPALLEYVGYGVYRTRAFPLQPNKPANVVVNYTTVCRKDSGLVEVFYPLNTEKFSARKIGEVRVTVDIRAPADITAVYSPSHDLKVQKDPKDLAHVTASYQAKDELPDIDFQVYYRAADEKIGATVLSHKPDEKTEGYFLALVSPSPKAAAQHVASKDVVIVLDHSGSMSQDRKIEQAKEAMKYILSNLREEDRFNVVTFCDSVDSVFPALVGASRKNVEDALDSLARLEATSGTNISGALAKGFGMFGQDDRPGYLLFITDGLPTIGERNEANIQAEAKKANKSKVRLFALGVGYDVNARLLDRLVRDNRGASDYVKPREPLEAKISSLYNKVKRPVMTDVRLSLKDVRVTLTYPQELPDLFDGSQILLVGRYDKPGKTALTVTGTLEGKEQTFSYPVALEASGGSNKNKFVERLWAIRRIGFLLDQVQLNGESKEVVDELVRLSLEYGVLTPYTAFLADETVSLKDKGDLRGRAGREADALSKSSEGASGQRDAMNRQLLNEAARAPVPTARPGSAPGAATGGGTYQLGYSGEAAYEAGEEKRVDNVQNVGNQAMYRRGRVWVTPETAKLDLEKDADKIKEVKRFTDEYFELVGRNTVSENQILASQQADEELLIKLRGQVYRIR